MAERPMGSSEMETWSNEHNYGVLNTVCVNMHQILMRLILPSDDSLQVLIQLLTARILHTCGPQCVTAAYVMCVYTSAQRVCLQISVPILVYI